MGALECAESCNDCELCFVNREEGLRDYDEPRDDQDDEGG